MSQSVAIAAVSREIMIAVGRRRLSGFVESPESPIGIVAFAHGSGSNRFSPRNQFVAHALHQVGLATLLVDLLTEDEADDRDNVFDTPLLASRLSAAVDGTLGEFPSFRELPLGLFGASTGAAAALLGAANRPQDVAAVVSRGGRPDLAWEALPRVMAPTLLIVGGDDECVLQWNRNACERLTCVKELVVIPGATHLFPEPGAFEQVVELTSKWFVRHIGARHSPRTAGTTCKSMEAPYVSRSS